MSKIVDPCNCEHICHFPAVWGEWAAQHPNTELSFRSAHKFLDVEIDGDALAPFIGRVCNDCAGKCHHIETES